MPLVIATTNTTGLAFYAVVDRVDTDGVDVSPALRWDPATEDFIELDEFADPEDAWLLLQESSNPLGYYEHVVEEIDGAAENCRITIIYDNRAIGTLYNIPLPLVNPDVTIDLTVTEDRD